MILGVALLAAPIVIGAECLPFLIAHHVGEGEPGEDDGAIGHPRHGAEQGGDCGSGGGDTRGDGEARRRRARPAAGGGAEQAVAAIGEVNRAAPGKLGGPGGDDRLQPVERFLPVAGEIVGGGDRLGEFRRRNFLDRQRVERAGKVGGEAHRFGRAFPAAPDDRGERELAGERVDRGGDKLVTVGGIERAADAVVEVGITDRDQARQDEPAAAGADERLGDAADRAVVGKQYATLGERHWIAAVEGNQPRSERIGETAVRRDREDGWAGARLIH